jgi:hypothetical protein
MARHPHDIVPRDDKDDLLLAIYDVLVDLRDALAPTPAKASEPDAPVTEAEASEAASVLATHEHQTTKKPAARKAPAKRRTRKKPA